MIATNGPIHYVRVRDGAVTVRFREMTAGGVISSGQAAVGPGESLNGVPHEAFVAFGDGAARIRTANGEAPTLVPVPMATKRPAPAAA